MLTFIRRFLGLMLLHTRESNTREGVFSSIVFNAINLSGTDKNIKFCVERFIIKYEKMLKQPLLVVHLALEQSQLVH